MEKFLEFSDIALTPVEQNRGGVIANMANLAVVDEDDITGFSKSLPIFTSPMESIVGKEDYNLWQQYGIRAVIPRTDDIRARLELCGKIFCGFSIPEVKDYFINQDRRGGSIQYHICIDVGNGHDVNVLNICKQLKDRYQKQVLIMAGNVADPKSYINYSKAGIDYMRLGISCGSLVNHRKYGFHYPMAQLLIDLRTFINSGSCVGLRKVKIIADGGIECYADIMKAIALGADYVMIGREFARIEEANGAVAKKDTGPDGKPINIPIDPSSLIGMSLQRLNSSDYYRYYFSNTSEQMQAKRDGFRDVDEWKKRKPKNLRRTDTGLGWEMIKIDTDLKTWYEGFEDVVIQDFIWANATTWEEYKKNMMKHIARLE